MNTDKKEPLLSEIKIDKSKKHKFNTIKHIKKEPIKTIYLYGNSKYANKFKIKQVD